MLNDRVIMYKLIEKSASGTVDHPLDGDCFYLGRSAQNDIIIQNLNISRRHFQITITDQSELIVTDKKSANGTYINGVRLNAEEATEYQIGDYITVGDTEVTFHIEKLENVLDFDDKTLISDSSDSIKTELRTIHQSTTVPNELVNIQIKKANLLRERSMQDIELLREETLLELHEEGLKIKIQAQVEAEQIIDMANQSSAQIIEDRNNEINDLVELISNKHQELQRIDKEIDEKASVTAEYSESIENQMVMKEELTSLSDEVSAKLQIIEGQILKEKVNLELLIEKKESEKSKFKLDCESIEIKSKLKRDELESEIERLKQDNIQIEKSTEYLRGSQNVVMHEIETLKNERIELSERVGTEKERYDELSRASETLIEKKALIQEEISLLRIEAVENKTIIEGLLAEAQTKEENIEKMQKLALLELEEQQREKEKEIDNMKESMLKEAVQERDSILSFAEIKKEEARLLEVDTKEKRIYLDEKVKEVNEGIERRQKSTSKKIQEDIAASQRKIERECLEIREKAIEECEKLRSEAGILIVEAKKRAKDILNESEERARIILEKTEAHARKVTEESEKNEKAAKQNYKDKEELANTIISNANENAIKLKEDAELELAELKTKIKSEEENGHIVKVERLRNTQLESDELIRNAKIEAKRILDNCKEVVEKKILTCDDEIKQIKATSLNENKENKKNLQVELNRYKLKQMKIVEEELLNQKLLTKEKEKARIRDIARNIVVIVNQSYSNHMAKKLDPNSFELDNGEVTKLVKAAFDGKKDLESSKLHTALMINPESSLNRKKFLKRVGLHFVLPVALLLIVLNTYTVVKDYFIEKNKENSTSEFFVQKLKAERESKYHFEPKQDLVYKNTYVDNILYTKDYAELALNKSFQSRYVIALNTFIIEKLDLDESVIVNLNTIHTNLITDVLKSRNNIVAGFEKSEIDQMRVLEDQAIKKQRELLRTKTKYNQFKEFEQNFYFSY